MNKAEKKDSREKYKEAELTKFKASLPMDELEFPPLFDFLDAELLTHGCKGDLSLLQKYCEPRQLNFESLQAWFRDHGGYCDCEIVSNVEEKFYYLDKPTANIQPKKKTPIPQREKLQSLTTDFGFSINKVPSPWLLIASYQNKGTITYQFQVGKKSDFPLLLKNEFPVEKLSDDLFLQNYWIKEVDLDSDLDFVIDRTVANKFIQIQVKTKRWIPIFLFVYDPTSKWYLVMKTESQRVKNDSREIEKLLDSINSDQLK